MKILAIDLGERYIGLAVSDDYAWSAQGLSTLTRLNWEKDFSRINEIIKRYQVKEVVVGLPRHLNGSLGLQGQKVMSFVNQLRQRLNLPVATWDERLSTVTAERVLLEADVSRKGRKKVIDKLAAVIILQGYLDWRRRKSLDVDQSKPAKNNG